MTITAKYVFTAAMDVDPDKEDLFNEVYDREHAPALSRVPGVISVTRLKLDTLRVSIGGETKTIAAQGAPRYAAIFELENPDVLVSAAWAKAVEEGRWPTEVRPFTRNRQHTLHKVMK